MEHSQSTGEGQVLAGRYRLGETIGSGGMGKVWRAHDELLHRTVAVKELTAGRYASEADRAVLHQRTQKEARAAARITHPGVVTVHDVLDHDARPWIVMQYVDGPSLAEAAKEAGRIEVPEAARIGLQVLGALSAAHAAGVLHRDVKPGNVLLARDGSVLLTDFGIAAIEGDSTITRTGELVGSIDYLAPERVRGSDPGPASDLWSLGATLYTAVQGVSPFRRNSALSTMQAVVTEEPPHPDHAGALAPVIRALLTKDPAARPGAAEVERMLRELVEGRAPTRAYAYPPVDASAGRATEAPPQSPMGPAAGPAVTSSNGSPAGQFGPAPQPGAPFPGAYQPPAYQPPAYPQAGGDRPPETNGWLPAEVPTPTPSGRGQDRGDTRLPASTAGAAHATTYASTHPSTHASTQTGGGRRWRRTLLAVVLAAVVGGGAGFAAIQYSGGKDDPKGTVPEVPSSGASPTPRKPRAKPPTDETKPSGVSPGAGYEVVHAPEGFTTWVPKGWKRDPNSKTIDFTPDGGNHLIRISIDETPDFPNPVDHLRDLERSLEVLDGYHQVQLGHYDFRDQDLSARWEFTWNQTAKDGIPGPRHAIDHIYYTDDNMECAIYISSPEEDWTTTQKQFATLMRNWQPPGAAD